ncbi:MAG: heparinase II/III domain-containing protein, partial [Planctomycetota bacterium]
NTVMVNGVGQQGEGRAWFDGNDLCKENRGAKILAVGGDECLDYVIGDVTDAYKKDAGLAKFLRHIYWLRPAVWVVVDELEAAEPATFEVFFHGEFPFEKEEGAGWSVTGERGALRLWTVIPSDVSAETFKQNLKGTGGTARGEIDTLKISNAQEAVRQIFVTVLAAYSVQSDVPPDVRLEDIDGRKTLIVTTKKGRQRLRLSLEREGEATPVLALE